MMVLTVVMVLNLLCLVALVMALWRLIHPPIQADPAESFARVLAAATPFAQRLVGEEAWAGDGGLSQRTSAPVKDRGCSPEAAEQMHQ